MPMNLRSLFPTVEPEERAQLRFAVIAFMCVAAAGVVARTAGSAMFLSRFEAASLAPMYVASALILMGTSFGFGWLVARRPLASVISATSLVLVVGTLLLRIGEETPWQEASAAATYLFSDLIAKFPPLLFWSFAATMFNPRQAKRLFVLVGAGGTLACVVAGALIGPFAKVLGMENLLFPVALLLGSFGVVIWRWTGIRESLDTLKARRVRSGTGLRHYKELLELPQVRNLALLAVIAAGSLLLTDFLFKSAARAHYVAADLAGFFGLFYSASGLTALMFQIFLVHTILRRGGVVVAASILPASLLVASVGVALTGGFGWVTAAKFVDPVFDFTVSAAAMQLLYLGIRKQSRSGARALIEGVAKPVATTMGGLFLVSVAAFIEPRAIALIVASGCLVWLIVVWMTCRSYVAGLLDSIGVHHFDPADEALAFDDPAVENHVRQALRTAPDEEVLYLLGIASHMDNVDLRIEFRELMARNLPEIKVAALDHLRRHGTAEDAPWARAALDHEAPGVRTAAIRALSALAREDATRSIEVLLDDPDADVRAAATTELINVGDLEGLLAACTRLKEMLRSGDERDRASAARAIANVNHAGLSKLLADLLSDPDLTVRRAALLACADRPDPRLIPSILPVLSDPDLAVSAVDVLGTFGRSVIDYLASFPDDVDRRPVEELLLIPSVLAQTRDAAALPLLERALGASNVRLRTRVIAGYCELVASLPRAQRPTAVLEEAAHREIAASQIRANAIRELSSHEEARLLTLTLEEERLELLENAFVLVGALHPAVNIRSILWVLRSGGQEQRAQGIEVLDNVLDGKLKTALLAVFEPVAETSVSRSGQDQSVEALLSTEHSEWIVASAAYTAGRIPGVSSTGAIHRLLASSSWYVREAALDAYSRLAGKEAVRSAAQSMVDDPSERVRKVALRIMDEVRA